MSDESAREIEDLVAEIKAGVAALPERRTAALRELRRGFSRRLAQAPPERVVAIALRLLDEPDFFNRFIGYEIVAQHRAAMRSLDATLLPQLGRGLTSWYDVDSFAPLLSGPAWREGQVPDSLIHAWAHSADRWWRRAALVSTIGLNNRARGGRGDTARTLAVCRLLVDDRDDMVEKALSWALRELAKHDAVAVRDFLTEQGPRPAARVRREVNNKLGTGLKNPQRATTTKEQ